ncbi:MAG: hypothetical protein HC800_02750 [Phormidesmis sp. RL_2_1]|nr:hypothetical protein [Phormidesmis sp. RL_2_1]
MSAQLNTLSDAFDAVGDLESEGQAQWGRMLFPHRIMQLLRAVKSVMQWWQQRDDYQIKNAAPAELVDPAAEEQDKRDYPERYTDQASVNRSLLDR